MAANQEPKVNLQAMLLVQRVQLNILYIIVFRKKKTRNIINFTTSKLLFIIVALGKLQKNNNQGIVSCLTKNEFINMIFFQELLLYCELFTVLCI